jgi:hypothetical protein
MRKWVVGTLILLLIVGVYWRMRAKPRPLGMAYVGEPTLTLYATTAQVRQSIGEVHWGYPVEVLRRIGGQTQVRTVSGVVGWMDGHALLDRPSWDLEARHIAEAHTMPVQALGRTKVFTNVRLEPGREATRIYQLPGGVSLAVLGRKVAEAPQTTPAATADKDESPRREDWLFVSTPGATPGTRTGGAAGESGDSQSANQAFLVTGNGTSQKQTSESPGPAIPPLAGWVLGRFIDLELPDTVRDYATSAGMRPVAWFVLNRVATPSGQKPEFLVAGAHGAEGQECDFSLLRVYTWGAKRQRYETAFVESDLCGYLPIQLDKQASTGDPEFRFSNIEGPGPRADRVYEMHQTSVRRVRETPPAKGTTPAKRASNPKAN